MKNMDMDVRRKGRVLQYMAFFDNIIVVTERINTNRKADKHEHRSILQSFHR